ncbi:hypothetical protein DBR43_09555 [Pedobacter sp. KBW06]|uniref:helix-turn-helix domain-containing protein n=1 Tax=Pedobacter sp. KBW06 TaxID=2153359 RepID=UPI000F59E233|nr:helix-turn-helix domain-containing protein [Pedobacter sp. KBW06]RQO75573.1 hypothetical protein DBR43_09555 [Pedobacter sp. KBW06]
MSKINKAEGLTENALIQSLLGKIDPAEKQQIAIRMKVAGVIADQLTAQKISKGQLAEKLDRNPSVITKWLSGTHNFTIDTLSVISSCLAIPMSEFFTEPEEPLLSSVHLEIKDWIQGDNVPIQWGNYARGARYLKVDIPSVITETEYAYETNLVPKKSRSQTIFHLKGITKLNFSQLTVHSDDWIVADEKPELLDPKSFSKV